MTLRCVPWPEGGWQGRSRTSSGTSHGRAWRVMSVTRVAMKTGIRPSCNSEIKKPGNAQRLAGLDRPGFSILESRTFQSRDGRITYAVASVVCARSLRSLSPARTGGHQRCTSCDYNSLHPCL